MFDFLKKDKDSKDLKLSDYKNIWTKFCFLDESGTLNDINTPFFTIGLIKCSQPYYINSKIIYERQKRNFHDELKFNKLSKNNFDFAKHSVDLFFTTKSLWFNSYTLDKNGQYFNKNFGGDPWKAYEDISIQLLKATLSPNEILMLIADYVTVPDYVRFEVDVKRKINEEFGRLALAGVCRFNSKSNDLLQLVDLMIGAINYNLKLETGIIFRGDKYKRRFVEHFKNNLGVKSFIDGFKNFSFNIFVDKDVKRRLSTTIEKRPSS